MTNTQYNLKWYFKHKRSKKRTRKILKTIENYRGKTNPKLIKLANEYAQEVLGDKRYAYWLHIYCALQNRFVEGWIPDDYYKKIVVPKLNGNYGQIAEHNFILPHLFNETEMLDLAYVINGKFCTRDTTLIAPETLKKYLFNNTDKIVFKKEYSKQGKGVYIIEKKAFNTDEFVGHNYDGVFREFINQHEFFNDFAKQAVATIRITTALDSKGEVSAKAAYIRFGRAKDSHIISNSAISVAIAIDTGELHPKGYMNWKEISKHPDSNVAFKNKIIPNFKGCKAQAIKMHKKLPFMGCIGWDFSVDKNETVQFIELNAINNGIKFSEATSGPNFKALQWETL